MHDNHFADTAVTTPLETPITQPSDSTTRFRDRVRAREGVAELLVFRLGDERFGVDVRAVDEVLESPDIYPVPGTTRAFAGVCQLNGRTLPVARGALVLGVDSWDGHAVLVFRRGDERVGLLVDDVDDVVRVSLTGLRQPPHEEDGTLLAIHWDGDTLLSVLDARPLVNAAVVAARQAQ